MNRRDFVRQVSALLIAGPARLPLSFDMSGSPHIAFTFDDPSTEKRGTLTGSEINERMLAALAKHRIKAALFVCGKRIDSAPGRELITAWDSQAHLIGNHSYSHFFFDDTGLQEFEADVAKNEPLIFGYAHFTRLFRFPFFKEGDTQPKRDGMRAFLQAHGYRQGRATIDASDWAISARLEKRLDVSPDADLTPYRDFYLQHIWNRAQFYDLLAQKLSLGPVRHTVLLHHNALNALYLDDLISMFQAKGWKLVDAEYAYKDPIYDRQPNILPAGESLIWALAKESGNFEQELRYPGEDDVYENPKMDALKL